MDMTDSMKPTLYLNSKDLPEIKNWKVGESYDLIVSVKQTGLHEGQGGVMMGEFEVQSVMSANNDPMELEDINSISGNEQFMQAAGNYRQRNEK